MPTQPAWRRARRFLDAAPVCDGLLPWVRELLPPGARLVNQLARFRAAGIDHVSLTAAIGRDDARMAMTRLGWLRREIAECGEAVVIAHDAPAIEAARQAGRLSVSFHFQTATPFADDLDLVDAFLAAGVRRALLAYNTANLFADGSHEPRNAGLSQAGRALIRRMDEAGMTVDLSHCGERSALDALEAGLSRPPIFSHSNARALFDHERSLRDPVIRAIGAVGGYVGVSGVGFFLGDAATDLPRAVAAHAAHMAELAGVEAVGLGLDYMYLTGSDYAFLEAERARWPKGYPDPPWRFLEPEEMGDLVGALEEAGFDEMGLAGILGRNYLARAVAPASQSPSRRPVSAADSRS